MKNKIELLYDVFDSLENHLSSALITKRVTLMSKTFEEAHVEGCKIFAERIDKGSYVGWDGKKYPRNPRLICEVPLIEPLNIIQS